MQIPSSVALRRVLFEFNATTTHNPIKSISAVLCVRPLSESDETYEDVYLVIERDLDIDGDPLVDAVRTAVEGALQKRLGGSAQEGDES